MRAYRGVWHGLIGASFLLLTPFSQAAIQPEVPQFGPLQPVTELQSTAISTDTPFWMSEDHQRIVFASNRAGDWRLYSATRASTASPFAPPTTSEFALINAGVPSGRDIRGATLSSDELELFFSTNLSSDPINMLYRATRSSTSDPFSNPQLVPGVFSSTVKCDVSDISNDGLRLYFWGYSGQPFMATRPDRNSPFGSPTHDPFVNFAGATSGHAETLVLTDDELQAYFRGNLRMCWTWRADIDSPFATPVQLSSINTANVVAPVPAGNELFLRFNGKINRTLMIPEPAAAALLLALATLAPLSRRRRSA